MKESKLQFSNPTLESLEYIKNKGFNEEKTVKMPIESQVEVKKAKDTSLRSALVILKVNVGSHDSTSPFFVSVVMSSEFHWGATLKDEMVESLLKCNAPALLLSYIRPHISNLTNSSNYPSFNLPFMDFSESEDPVSPKEPLTAKS